MAFMKWVSPAEDFLYVTNMINIHHRIMTKSPVCLTHETPRSFFDRFHIPPPSAQIQRQQTRIQQALQARTARFRFETMTEDAPDVCVSIPTLWSNDLTLPTDSPDSHAAQEITCPECHRMFKQVGMLKRHMRRCHDIPCEPDDLFCPLRDAWNDRPICNHCSHSFVDFCRLRNHINKRVYPYFNAAQESITPIVARADLRMHLRHKSIPGLLLNNALMAEFAQHCAFCHYQIASRSIHKHYPDQRPQLVQLERRETRKVGQREEKRTREAGTKVQ